MRHAAALLLLATSATLSSACPSTTTSPPDESVKNGYVLPPGFPDIPVPDDNAMSEAKVELGRHLFYDVRLSANQTQSCGSCHEQRLAFADGVATPEGSTGMPLARNSQGLANVAYNSTYTWANPLLTTLELQIMVPLFGEHPVELGATGHEDEILQRLHDDDVYAVLFAEAFDDDVDTMTFAHVVDSLACFVRSMLSGHSRFDRYVHQDDKEALTDDELHGMELFYSETLECHHCHGGFNFTESTTHDNSAFDATYFHNTGLYNVDGEGGYPVGNAGLYDVTGRPEDMGAFRPPTLRNIALTAPYMHDGTFDTLDEVLEHYARGGTVIDEGPHAGDGKASPLKSGLVAGFTLADDDKADLIAFLHALTDDTFITDERFSDPFD